MTDKILKTSDEWQQELMNNITVIDPDGWTRNPVKEFNRQWYEMKITRDEFLFRCWSSTCRWNVDFRAEWDEAVLRWLAKIKKEKDNE